MAKSLQKGEQETPQRWLHGSQTFLPAHGALEEAGPSQPRKVSGTVAGRQLREKGRQACGSMPPSPARKETVDMGQMALEVQKLLLHSAHKD